MSKAIKIFNGLSGSVTLAEVNNLALLAEKEGQTHLATRLRTAIKKGEKQGVTTFTPGPLTWEQVPACEVPGVEQLPDYITPEDFTGLNKPVSADEIYTAITNRMIAFIKEAKKTDYKKKWEEAAYGKGYLIPFNFVSKKRYRGVNNWLLTDYAEPLKNPFFLTFKQIEKLGGKLKKGSLGEMVVYFTRLYSYKDDTLNFATYDKKKFGKWFEAHKHQIPKSEHKLDHVIPILKYYKIFNGKDIEGIDFDLKNFKTGYIEQELPPNEKMPIPDAIWENYPAPRPSLKHGGDRAFFRPSKDVIQLPYKADFDTTQDYYRTFFHEMAHSTGIEKRLNRDMSGISGGKKYAFEELVAELSSVFLSAEAGFMWHTNKNHAAYLKGWNSVLTHIENDNRFVMRAASQAQKAADFVLQPNEEGEPKYIKDLLEKLPKEEKPTAEKSEQKQENTHKFKKADTVQFSKRWGNVGPGTEGTVKELRKSVHGDPMYKVVLENGKDGVYPEDVLQLPKKKLNKKELEKANPAPVAKKPKSVSAASVIDEILALPKYKGISKIQANILYKHFKNDVENNDLIEIETTSPFEIGNLKKETKYHYLDGDIEGVAAIVLTDAGRELIKSIYNRVESLRNQKHNYSFFDGLKGSWHNKQNKYRSTTNEKQRLKKGFKFLSDGTIQNVKTGKIYKDKEKKVVTKTETAKKITRAKPVKKTKKVLAPKTVTENGIEILKTSPKGAMLISDGKKTAWIMPKQRRADGSFTPGALKALENGNAYQSKEEWKKNKIADDYIRIYGPWGETSTGKALYTNVRVFEYISDQSVRRKYFVPKSLVIKNEKDYIIIPRWFHAKKREEIFESAETNSFHANTFELEIDTEPVSAEELRGLVKGLNAPENWKDELTGLTQLKQKFDPKKLKGLKSPYIEPKTKAGEASIGGNCRPLLSGKHPNVRSIKHQNEQNPLFAINGETARFLQAVEKKPIESVVVTLDGPQGAGKTTAMYSFLNDFATAGNRCFFASLEEHPSSNLAIKKRDAYLTPTAQENIDTVGSLESYAEFIEIAQNYDAIFIDSWQKLVRMIGAIRLDEDVRKKLNGKVFFIIFQQTTTGRTKGGAEIVFDGDIIIKLEKRPSFSDNYAYFDKNRYTTVPLETVKYMIEERKTVFEGENITETPAQNVVIANNEENNEMYNFKVY